MNNADFRAAYLDDNESYLYNFCTSASYVLALLNKGFKFPLTNTGIVVVDKINGTDASWALGSIIAGANSIFRETKYEEGTKFYG